MSVGSELRHAREARGLTLADVARLTRVRAGLLEQIEADNFAACGGAVYARGHIKAFASAVGLDAAPLLADYDAHYESVPVPVLSDALPAVTAGGIKERRETNWLAVGVGGVAALTIALAVTYATGGSSPHSGVDATRANDIPTATPHTTRPSGLATPSAQPTILAQLAPVVVRLKVTKPGGSWVLETQDGTASSGQVFPDGTTKQFTAQRQIKLRLGNAGAVDLTVNGKHLGAPGADGQVVNVSFGPSGTSGQG